MAGLRAGLARAGSLQCLCIISNQEAMWMGDDDGWNLVGFVFGSMSMVDDSTTNTVL